LATGPPTPRLLCKFQYWNYAVVTSVRSVKKAFHTSDFSLTSNHPETKNLANLKYKKGQNSGKNCLKFVTIKLDLDIHNIHLYTTHSFNLTFCSHVIIWKPDIFVSVLHWDPIIKQGRVYIPLTGLTLSHFCASTN
jgi:hypothetical protein